MNRFIFLLLSLTIISCLGGNKPDIVSSITVDQNKNNFYINSDGQVFDNASYISKRKIQLEKLKKVSSSFRLYEKLEKNYEKNDSVVYSYTWRFSDRLEKTIEADKKKSQNLGTIYPISNAKTLEGKIIDIKDLKGKPTLVNLWFTKCAPCIKEMPVLNKMKSKYEERFNFLSVTTDEAKEVRAFLEKTKFDFTHIVGSKILTTELGFEGFPVNLFLDKEGIIRKIEGNVPYTKDEKGKIIMSDGGKFIEVLKGLE